MTSIPKPLKFLSPHYVALKTYYETLREDTFKKEVADLISVLGITMSEDGSFDSLNFALQGTRSALESWGHQYIRSLGAEVADKYNILLQENKDPSHLDFLVDIVVPHLMKTHEEPEAVDLLLEVEQVEKIVEFADENTYNKVCQYLMSCAKYAADQEEMQKIYTSTFRIFMKLSKYPSALLVAQKLNNQEFINEVMESCEDGVVLK